MNINRVTIRPSLQPRFFVIVLLFLASAASVSSQTKRLVELPQSDIYSVVMIQPGNPLLIINPHAYYNLDTKRVEFSFGARNTGKKPIIGFQVSAYWDMGTGGTLGTSWSEKEDKKILLPGQEIDAVDKEQFESVPITPEIRKQFKFKDSPSRLLFLGVEYVFFKDGSRLDFNNQTMNLANFLSNNCWDKNQ